MCLKRKVEMSGTGNTLVVTLDVGTSGFNNPEILEKVLRDAVRSRKIGSYQTLPDGFEFRSLGGGTTCPTVIGRNPSALPHVGNNWANLMVNNIFPCDGYITGFEYNRGTARGKCFIGIWSRMGPQTFKLHEKILVPEQAVGVHRLNLTRPIPVKKGDFIGVHYDRDTPAGVISYTMAEDGLVSPNELYRTYQAEVFNDRIIEDVPIDFRLFKGNEITKTFALKSIVDYNYVPPSVTDAPEIVTCTSAQFRCADGTCIDRRRKCDRRYDCPDQSDEQNCPIGCRSDLQFRCSNGQCVDESRKCNGRYDCLDGSDELNCPDGNIACNENQFRCGDGRCVPITTLCNGRQDCLDNSDEIGCPTEGCRPGQFVCRNGACLDASLRCDSKYDCTDGSDETGCAFSRCFVNEFRCRSGQCIDYRERCNRRYDCPDRSDELNCPIPTCSPREFRCSNGICIDDRRRCDQRYDCTDASDERNCSSAITLRINPEAQRVRAGNEAIFECTATGNPPPIVRWSRGNIGLPSSASEVRGRLRISNPTSADAGEYTCTAIGVPGNYQLTARLVVDPVGPTQKPPEPGDCDPAHEARCTNRQCIAKDYVCDGDYDCADRSDEANCVRNKVCYPNEFMCTNGKCVQKIWWCDGDDDCGDKSDEKSCPTVSPDRPCRYDEYQCVSGPLQCIPSSYQCDGEIDCQDRSDEIGCAPPIVTVPPVPTIEVTLGDTVTIYCEATGVPTPLIIWRLNWGHIPDPPRVTQTSEGGRGVLTITNAMENDQGAYTCEAMNSKGLIFATPDAIVTVNPPTGVCVPPNYNSKAKSARDCLRCFCFGHTTNCFSSKLFRSQLVVGSTLAVVSKSDQSDLFTGRPVVDYSPSTRAFTIRDYDRKIPRGNYYWSLPKHFLGNKLGSYGGKLYFRIYYNANNDNGRPTNEADVIISGNGKTLYYSLEKQPQKNSTESIMVPLTEDAWSPFDPPRRTAPTTRNDLMMVLQNLTYILVKSQYDDFQSEVRISNILMDITVEEDQGRGTAHLVEDCSCPIGYTGRSCEICSSGYYRVKTGPYLGTCQPCECNQHSNECHPETGVCIGCLHNTRGVNCELCEVGFYPRQEPNGIACLACTCPSADSRNQFSKDCYLGPNDRVVCRNCPEGYVGDRCERCAPGYRGDPNTPGDTCKRDQLCDHRGSLSETPDATGWCPCKRNVRGTKCDQCAHKTFYLSTENAEGCLNCFCADIGDVCGSSGWFRDRVSTQFGDRELKGFGITNYNGDLRVSRGLYINPTRRALSYRPVDRVTYYWKLPDTYLNDKLTAFGGTLKYSVFYTSGTDRLENRDPDVVLIGENGKKLIHRTKTVPKRNEPSVVEAKLTQDEWKNEDGSSISRNDLLTVLMKLKAVHIKASYTRDTRESSLSNVSMSIARERNTGGDRAYSVEQCQCPKGYTGLSCQTCEIGYYRVATRIKLGECAPCNCHGHSSECDPDTGVCRHCSHNTEGPKCDRCRDGYYGDATRGSSSDCLKCPCPLTFTSNQFGKTCQLAADGDVTCNCPPGYEGRRCQRCAPGFEGNPEIPGQSCTIRESEGSCDCDPRGTRPDRLCDARTGICPCKDNVMGRRCDRCKPGYFSLRKEDPSGCMECYCSGESAVCRESNYNRTTVRPSFRRDGTHDFGLVTRNDLDRPITVGFVISVPRNEITFSQFNDRQNEGKRLFWTLPGQFKGNKITSYGGYLRFTLHSIVSVTSGFEYVDVDVELISQRVTLLAVTVGHITGSDEAD
ncbi:basement membrane-specific heparan sulfate proteoglycan core protein-like [Tubulanus polymorphus]|uniref:basement membrane-specific heparan sulfate proteoglycan core protein-like n=1 Tax=Tubulanus polymorphus TaxID=672921 RepID=UPI003DA264FF